VKIIYNYSSLFNLFSQDKKDLPTRVLEKIGVFLFTTAFVIAAVSQFFGDSFALVAIWGSLLIAGLLMFMLVGIRVVGQHRGKTTFLSQLLFVLGKVFLYIFLPALIITLVLVIYAFASKQW